MAKRGQLPGAIKTGGRWKIPTAADMKLTDAEGPENLSSSDELSGVPANKKDQALRCLGTIQDFEQPSFAEDRREQKQLLYTQPATMSPGGRSSDGWQDIETGGCSAWWMGVAAEDS
jgi:hypothetical protein